MRTTVLVIHNSYRELGGEDVVVQQERELLKDKGHVVVEYSRSNAELRNLAFGAATAVWSLRSRRELGDLVDQHRPRLAHVHNTFAVVSPSIYSLLRDRGLAVVQTLHNYRAGCPAGTFLRNGRICEKCLGKSLPWPAVVHGCYRESRLGSLAASSVNVAHRLFKAWDDVDRFIVPTQFARAKLAASGVGETRVHVKPHFVHPDPGAERTPGAHAVYVGRLIPEKGILTLLQAWSAVRPAIPLLLIGDGPSRNSVEEEIARRGLQGVRVLGKVPRREVLALVKSARFLIFPSELFETFGMAIIEAFACGTPVLASRLGASEELIEERRTGRLFECGNAQDLAEKASEMWADHAQVSRMGRAARAEYEARYTRDRNYQELMAIYELASQTAPSRGRTHR